MILYRLDDTGTRTRFYFIDPDEDEYEYGRYDVRDHGWLNCEPFIHSWVPVELGYVGAEPQRGWKLLAGDCVPILSERGMDVFKPLFEPYGEFLECWYQGELVFAFHCLIGIDPCDHERIVYDDDYGSGKHPFSGYRQMEFFPDKLPDPGMFKLPDISMYGLFLSTSEPDKFELLRLLEADRDFKCTQVWTAKNYRRLHKQDRHDKQQPMKRRRKQESESAMFVYQVNINDTRTRFNFIDPEGAIGIQDLGHFKSLRNCKPYGDSWKPLEVYHLGKKP